MRRNNLSLRRKTTVAQKDPDKLIAKFVSDGTKLKPTILFKGAVRECKVLCQEFRTQAVLARSPNGWMNTELTLQRVENVIGAFSFKRRLLVWNSYECHIEDTVKKSLTAKKIDPIIVPDGCTKYFQAPDVSWNKTFKANCARKYNWLAKEGMNDETEAGNLKTQKEIIKLILDAWAALLSEMIKKLFIRCALSLPTNGSCDDLIHFFKEG